MGIQCSLPTKKPSLTLRGWQGLEGGENGECVSHCVLPMGGLEPFSVYVPTAHLGEEGEKRQVLPSSFCSRPVARETSDVIT